MRNIKKDFFALKASAGSGKTFNLSLRFIYLLFQGANPHQILTLTFTKKASKEMHQRIHDYLKSLYVFIQGKDTKGIDIYNALLKEGLSDEVLRDKIESIYYEFMQANPRITTIDAFFHAVLKKFCWYVGISSHFGVGNVSKDNINERFLSALSLEDMREIVIFCFHHQIKITKFLSMLYDFYMFANEIVQTLSSTSTTAHLEVEDIEKLIVEKMHIIYQFLLTQPQVSQSAKNLFNKKDIQSICKNPKMLLDWNEHHYLKKIDLSQFNDVREEILKLLQLYFIQREHKIFAWIKYFIDIFKQAKEQEIRTKNLLGFDDVMLKNYELLCQNIERDFFYFRLDEKITHILLDEFQDTSLMQYQILQPIINEIKSGEGRISDRSIFIVGDEKQSIYMFRGSFAGLFEEAIKDFHQENLDYNFRSSPRVIAFNNDVFQSCFSHYLPQRYPHTQSHTKPNGYVRVLPQCIDDEELGLHKQICAELETLLQNGANEDDIAILTFKNDDVLSLKEYINTHIPHLDIITETNSSLFQQKEVKILICALKFILLHSQIQNGDDNVDFYKQLMNAKKLYEKKMIKLLGKPYMGSDRFIDEIKALMLPSTTSPSEAIFLLIEELDIAQVASMKFLELSFDYMCIEEFLDALPQMVCDAPIQNNKGIKIMTIHKSKGLEFEYVILCDRLSEPKRGGEVFIYEYENTQIKQVYYKMRERESFDKDYQKALQAHNVRKKQEEYNVLYVAFTRAKYGLSVVQKYKKSAFEILNLTPCYDEITHISTQQSKQDMSSLHSPRVLMHNMPSFGRQSAFIKHEKDEHKGIFDVQQWRNIMFGYALHSVFELYLGYKNPQEDIQSILYNRYGFALPLSSITQAIQYAINCIQSKKFIEIQKGKHIACEVSYIAKEHLYRIDTLLYDEKEWIVLDYKSSATNIGAQEEQIREYMRFLFSLNKKEKQHAKSVRGFIVYPLKNGDEQFYEVSL
ncbi:RecB-like helicase [Helicobacter sp. MIT 21-1697]|uniref:RecB-like helicase n=1 Tax=Helicobacter sp. MIT 21-1697 TaxID=2993733 RepID=UPI00224AC85E|nr:RecB-like helicase [Helicobacter sp. MIT 21-1697]MCX2717239.1 RecB-like helicase [Helicobacter sp. MIT 21-1697]